MKMPFQAKRQEKTIIGLWMVNAREKGPQF
jgi:hypothetical protein